MKKETIRDCFHLLEAEYGKQTNQKKELWGEMFKKYSDKQLIKAVGDFLRRGKFFPRVSDIIESIEGTSADEAELAWICLLNKIEREDYYKSVSFPDYPAIGAVVKAMGGWIEICDMKIDEEKWVKKEFIKMYPIMKKRGDYPDKLIGQFELDNGNRYTKKFMLEEYGRKLDGKKIDRKLIEDNSNPHSIVETGEKGR